jgi:hypothetical protein
VGTRISVISFSCHLPPRAPDEAAARRRECFS